ncbi:exodeoxyribonuclease V subunit beta [Shewanella sp. Isolate11]|uniref:exodeoxyribonuclease V subunit beta n=1 Tax=Shewanella sp. Isolate11 TaxID=2908530 RepID=UPI001EFD380F|nr:exodeoxyribonuclease V subunit beta [Shewanella sp. Isolate11]MCG9696531.1 exodeoxyribonuclease V subunit beta [Shewanella sp. Isolate11]
MASEKLDTLTLPLHGKRLIEASAGTGKTFTIAGLYIRLLLGDEQRKPLRCEEILVVTFTNAATGELRDRIRKKIQLAYRRFIGISVNDELIEQLYQQTPPELRPISLKRLDLALKSLDEAAIFTIHGFCQRILADMAFESSLLFESEFTLDDSEFLHHAVRDFWRETCYPLPSYLAKIIKDKFSDPDGLTQQIRALLGASQAVAKPKPAEFAKVGSALSQSLSRLQLIWPREREQLEQLLHQLPLNGTRFGKADQGYPKLAVMLDKMDNWAAGSLSLPDPKLLDALSLNNLKLNKGGEIPTPEQAPLLAHIENLNQLITQFIPGFLFAARTGIAKRFANQKSELNLLTPDDLLLTLAQALSNSTNDLQSTSEDRPTTNNHPESNNQSLSSLAASIAKRFPVALIDEFQDTDPLQYQIFSQIYQLRESSDNNAQALLMIGDPKQAIYAFRGADIHTYIDARQQTEFHYSLYTNYRSSRNMIAGVNQLFSQHADPFISEAIPFEIVAPSPFADSKQLIEQQQNTSALRIKLLGEDPDTGLNKASARKQLAEDSCNEIARLLTEAQQGLCLKGDTQLKAKDIAVLVRDRNEAAYIKTALSERQIGAVFLSRDSVFSTLEAKELALVLIAIANPKDERALRSALATLLLGYSAEEIHQFNQDEDRRQNLLELFHHLHQIWLKRGVMPCLLALANETQLIERLLNSSDGQRRLTDFRHLGELLQQKSTELDGINALLNWYQQTLAESHTNEEAQLRLESEQNLLQIVTIHKSKGLEYPVCFVPFVSLARDNRRKPAPMLYHDNNQLVWDIEQSDEGWQQHKRENLAEDLRLLYVALTRPVLACYLYVANHSRFTKKSGISSQLHETAIGYLLGIEDSQCDIELIEARANLLQSEAISVERIEHIAAATPLPQIEDDDNNLSPKVLIRPNITPWRVGSYSGLVKDMPHERTTPGSDDESFPELSIVHDEAEPIPSRFSFERGANAGSFMHLVLELIDFTQAETDLIQQLPIAMSKYGIDESWQPILHQWYLDLLNAPLRPSTFSTENIGTANVSTGSLCLAHLPPNQTLVEMEFYLPISQLQAQALNQLLSRHGYPMTLAFDTLQGMLKGFIDLTFEHNGQFYIADYKSNHLGDSFSDYQQEQMQQAISGHRYDLQYIIYTLALHRYLKLRLANYSYEQHIGGSYYLFLRGMSTQAPGCGVFYDKPPKALIEQFDALVQTSEIPTATNKDGTNEENANMESTTKGIANKQAGTPPIQTELDL